MNRSLTISLLVGTLCTSLSCTALEQRWGQSQSHLDARRSHRGQPDAFEIYRRFRSQRGMERFQVLNPRDFFSHEKDTLGVRNATAFVEAALLLRRNPSKYQKLRGMIFRDQRPILSVRDTKNDPAVFFRLVLQDKQSWKNYFSVVVGHSSPRVEDIGTIDRRLERGLSPVLHHLDDDIQQELDPLLASLYSRAQKATLRRDSQSGRLVRKHEGMGPKRIFDTYYRHVHKPEKLLLGSMNENRLRNFDPSLDEEEARKQAQGRTAQAYDHLVEHTRRVHGLTHPKEELPGERMGDYDLNLFFRILTEIQVGLQNAHEDGLTGDYPVSLLFGGSMARGTATLSESDIDGYFKIDSSKYFADVDREAAERLQGVLTDHLREQIGPLLSDSAQAKFLEDRNTGLQVGDDKSHPTEFVRNIPERNLGRINPIAFEVARDQICLVTYSVPDRATRYAQMNSPFLRVFELGEHVMTTLGEESADGELKERFSKPQDGTCHTKKSTREPMP